MVIPRIIERLQRHPHIKFTTSAGRLEVPAQYSSGFRVWIQEGINGCTIGFEGWHEEFAEADEALNCFVFGLTAACRLRVFRRGGMDYKWQVLHQADGQWVVDSGTALFISPFWRQSEQRELQNNVFPTA